MKKHLNEWLNIRVGTEQPKDAMEAHQLAKHYYHVARRQKMFGSDCTENMKLAKKFFEQYKELKQGGDSSDNDTLEEVDIDNEIENFSEDINEAGYKRPAVAARDRDIRRKSSKLRGRESVSSKSVTMFKKRHGGKTVANRPGTKGVPRSTGATGDKRALGGQGHVLQDLHNMPEDEFRRKHGKSKSAARTALRNESASPEQVKKWEDRSKEITDRIRKSPMRKAQAAAMRKKYPQATQKYSPTNEDHLRENSISVSMHSSGTKYKVHGVHKSIKGRIKPGEHLSDTHIDDLRDSGVKIRHVKPPKPTPKTAKPAVMGYRKEESEPTHAVTYTKGTRVGARSHRTVYVTADHEDHAEKVARKHPDHPGKGWRVTHVRKESVSEAAPVKEDDEGWYAHREIHGDKGVSKADWKKGVRMNRQGKKVQMSTGASARRAADLERYAHSRDRAGKKINEGGMKRMATQDAERERLGAKKVKGTGMKTFKKKPPVKEYGVDKERELAAKGDRYEEKEVSSIGTPLKKKRSWNPKTHKLIVSKPGGGVKVVPKSHPAPYGTAESVVKESKDSTNLDEHAPEVVEYIPHAYDYNRRSWEDSLAEVNRYKGRSGHRVTKPEKEEPEHIIMQMRKVQSLKKNHQGVDFHDGSRVKINPGHAAQVIDRHDRAKPAEKERIARTAAHSHDGLRHVASGKDIDDKSPGAPKKPMFKGAVRREPLRRVRHPDDD